MPTDYTSYNYFEPPRPSGAVMPGMLEFYQSQGWWAQVKKNGTNCLLFISPSGDVRAMNRHAGELRSYNPQPETYACIRKILPKKHWHVLNGEWLNDKAKLPKRVLYLFDILVYKGQYLVDTEYQTRYRQLQTLFKGAEHPERYEIATGLWLAKNFTDNFLDLFGSLADDADEGLVLKNPNGKLTFGKMRWAVKCRKPHKNYSF